MTIYNGPVEEPVENPTCDFLKNLFFSKGEDYWKQGGGDSCIEMEECNDIMQEVSRLYRLYRL